MDSPVQSGGISEKKGARSESQKVLQLAGVIDSKWEKKFPKMPCHGNEGVKASGCDVT
jgi:hypothetical protein